MTVSSEAPHPDAPKREVTHLTGSIASGSAGGSRGSGEGEECPENGKAARKDQTGSLTSQIWTSRLVFLVFLVVCGAILSWGAFSILQHSEDNLAEKQFDAIVDRALETAMKITTRKRLGAKSLATVVAHWAPNADAWPFVMIPGFSDIAQSVSDLTSLGTMGLAPRVKPEQIQNFVDYVHEEVFSEVPPNDVQHTLTGFDESNGFERYNETDGVTRGWKSNSNDLWPFSMHSMTNDILLFNLHSIERFGKSIDEMVNCTKHWEYGETKEMDLSHCVVISDIVVGFNSDGSPRGPSAFIYQPIFPANDTDALVGFVSAGIDWYVVVENLFSSRVSGIDVVLGTETTSFTYHVKNGIAEER